jgi:hypothetical protein
MADVLLTAAAALDAAARTPNCYLLRVDQREAALFCVPGWIPLDPPRDGCVIFIHRARELLVFRARGVL